MIDKTKEHIDILILGAGTGGTIMANRLRRRFSEARATITVVDQDEQHIYQPGLLFIPFGIYQPDEIVRPRSHQLHKGIKYTQSVIKRVIADEDTVEFGLHMTPPINRIRQTRPCRQAGLKLDR